MDKVFITIAGLFLIGFILWFFFGKREEHSTAREGKIEITVEGGYKPDIISIPLNKPTKMIFKRTDPSSCLEEVVLSDFKIRKFLPLNQKTEILLTPNKTGTFPFSCGMNMYHGKIVVKE